MSGAAWIAVDWGTSNLRAWAIGADGALLDEAASDASRMMTGQAMVVDGGVVVTG